jgi:AcrR family transcriptional regulator
MAVQSGTYRGQSADERAAERRERLLEATLAVWADPDQRTTMTAICGAAGLTERYFYESFANLDEALTAVMDTVAIEIEAITLAAANAAGPSATDRVYASIRAFLQLLVDDPRKGRVAIIESVSVPALRQRRTALLRYLAHRSAEEARSYGLAGHGERDDGPEDEVAGLFFIGGMAELVTAWLDGAITATPDELIEAAAHGYLGLYG